MKLTNALRKFIKKEFGSGIKFYCKKCGKELKNGDLIDHYFPYFDDNNCCIKCKKKDIDKSDNK